MTTKPRKIKVVIATIVDNESNSTCSYCGRTENQVFKKVWDHIQDDLNRLYERRPHEKPNGRNLRSSLELFFEECAEQGHDIWMAMDTDTV